MLTNTKCDDNTGKCFHKNSFMPEVGPHEYLNTGKCVWMYRL